MNNPMRRRRIKIPKLQVRDLWIAFFLLVIMAASVPSIDTTTGAGNRVAAKLAATGTQMFARAAQVVAR